jgi:CheY-like chemotaxis protein
VLRSVLRQDPDILLVGEIRDPETAATAAQAGLTGHLVLSTLHTNDAPSALVRLRDLGLDAFTLASVLQGVVAQRLVRRVCPRCAGAGCEHCDRSGYRGRIPIVEILPVTATVGRLLGEGAAPGAIADAARREGMRSLWESGLERVRAGRTTLQELERVVGSGHGGGPNQVRERPAARILVADDDPALRALARAVLTREGHAVDEAPDGFAALARAEREAYDLILLDVAMPGKDGFAVLDILRARPRTRDVPVVMLTAQGDAEVPALERGVRDFVVKPVRPEVLAARVRRVVGGAWS